MHEAQSLSDRGKARIAERAAHAGVKQYRGPVQAAVYPACENSQRLVVGAGSPLLPLINGQISRLDDELGT